jgi:hypothetical protein
VDALGHLRQKSLCDLLIGRVLREVDGDEELLSLLIDVTNIDTTFVSEEDPVALLIMLALLSQGAQNTKFQALVGCMSSCVAG